MTKGRKIAKVVLKTKWIFLVCENKQKKPKEERQEAYWKKK